MILQKTNHPSIMISQMWTSVTPYNQNLCLVQKRKGFKIIFSKPFSQRDKLILETALHQSQLKKSEIIKIDTNQMLDTLELKKNTSNKHRIYKHFENIKDLRITVQNIRTDQIILDLCIPITINKNDKGHREIIVDFRDFNREFKSTKKQKKYILNLHSNEMLWMYDFFRIKVQQKTKKNEKVNHPFEFRYRSFSQISVLKWFNLLDTFQISEEIYDTKEIKIINDRISKILRTLRKEADKRDLPFPKYKLIDGMYKVTDYGYISETKEININGEMYKKV